MSTNTTGAELKAFYADPSFWPEGAYHDDEEIVTDGVHKTSDIEGGNGDTGGLYSKRQKLNRKVRSI